MKPPKITVALAGLLGAGAGVTTAGTAGAAEVKKPNIIFVLADDLGYGDLGCYGGVGAPTPNIDRLASEGIRFTQFYVNAPICSPSRTAFTTGQYPARWGITSFIEDRAANSRRGMAQWLDLSAPSLARSLSHAGYLTGHFGKWHMGGGRDVGEAPLPTEYGFDESLTQFEGLGDRVLPILSGDGDAAPQKMGLGLASEKLGRGAVSWEERSQITGTFVNRALGFIQKADQAGKPFYLNLWPDDVHSPFDPPREGRGDGSKRALYHGVLTGMDAQLGPLFDAIRRNPRLRANTLIIFASDNGPEAGAGSAGPLRGTKGSLYEGGIREPLIVWGPGLIPATQRGTVNTSAVVSGVDFLPSLLSLAGAGAFLPAQSDGVDLSATLRGQKAEGRTEPLFWKRPPDRGGKKGDPLPDLAVRDGHWKLLVQEDGSRAQLFDLAKDAGETTNLATSQPQITRRLKEAVLSWNRSLPQPKPANHQAKSSAAEQFALKSGAHLDRIEAPDIAGRGFSIAAKFDTRSTGGVLVAQGGVANGYSLFVDEEGRLTFLIRIDKQSTSIASAKIGAGVHSAVAHFGRDGALSLSLDGQNVARGQAPAGFSEMPLDGLDIGADRGGLVGNYADQNAFGGVIEAVNIQLDPLDH